MSMKNFYVIFLTLAACSICVPMHADCSSSSSSCSCSEVSAQELGRKLVTRFWTDVEEQNVKGYSRQMTPNFQGLNIHGIFNRQDQIDGLQNLTVTHFELRNLFAAIYNCDTLVISYDFVAEGEGIVSGPSLDTWCKVRGQWKLVNHSYVPFED